MIKSLVQTNMIYESGRLQSECVQKAIIFVLHLTVDVLIKLV